MERYLLNLLPRLRDFGKKLNKIEEFADKTWVLRDATGTIITYRFKRNGLLRKTINGDIQDLHWELEGTDAISIVDPVSRRGEMFRHGFVLDGLLIVQKEGLQTTPLIFYNEAVVRDGDVSSYLFDIFIKKEKLRKVDAAKGYYFKQNEADEPLNVGAAVYDNELRPIEKEEVISLTDRKIFIRNGRIQSIVYFKTKATDKGVITITSSNYALVNGTVSVNDEIQVGSNTSYNGRLKILGGAIIKVMNGKVVDVSYISLPVKIGLIAVLILLVAAGFYFINKATIKSEGTDKANTALADTSHQVESTADVVLADTNAAAILPANTEVNQDVLNNQLEGYFTAINQREWQKVYSLLGASINYFGARLDRSTVLNKISTYWGGMSTDCGVILNPERVTFSVVGNEFSGTVKVIEYVEKGVYKIPYLYRADMTINMNSSYEIVSVNSKMVSQKPLFAKLFGLSEEVTDEDYGLRNKVSDWDSILFTLQRIANNTPSVFNEYVGSVIDVYGLDCKVWIGAQQIPLTDYLEMMRTGRVTFKGVSTVSGDGSGKSIVLSNY